MSPWWGSIRLRGNSRPSIGPHIALIPDFFSAELFREAFGARRARIVTSIAMFYDLEDPRKLHAGIA